MPKDNYYMFRSALYCILSCCGKIKFLLLLSKELKEKLIGSDREWLGLGLGIGLRLGSDRLSEPNTVQCQIIN